MAVFNGTTVSVSVDGTAVANSTGCTVEMSMDTIDVTSKDSSGKRDILPGVTSWTVSGDFLDSDADTRYDVNDFMNLVNSRTSVTVLIDGATVGSMTGTGYITSISGDFPMEDVATGSFTIEGTGTLTVVEAT